MKAISNHLMKRNVLGIFLILFAAFLCIRIATQTPYNAHPDEYSHLDAFHYFESNWWPPKLGTDEVVYSWYGVSHVYTGEIVYLVFGKIGYLLNSFLHINNNHYIIYRFFNIILFVITLSVLFFAPCNNIKTIPIALMFLCIPQISYIYSYANYDGWALSSNVFLFVWAIILSEKKETPWSWSATVFLGILTGMVLGARQPDRIGLVIPYSILGLHIFPIIKEKKLLIKYIVRLIIALIIAFSMASPLKFFYRYSQGNFNVAFKQMMEEKAIPLFKQSTQAAFSLNANAYSPFKPPPPGLDFNPDFSPPPHLQPRSKHNSTFAPHQEIDNRVMPDPFLYHLDQKGETYGHMLFGRKWFTLTYMSFYGGYGYRALWNPLWIYWLAGILLSLSLFISIKTSIHQWHTINQTNRLVLLLSPILFLLNLFVSIYHSMHCDFQPQGRYLFLSLIPFCILIAGTTNFESINIQTVRKWLFIMLYLLAVYCLFFVAPMTRIP